MTKKHFIAAARIISTIEALTERRRVAEEFAALFAAQNPNFRRATFMEACNA